MPNLVKQHPDPKQEAAAALDEVRRIFASGFRRGTTGKKSLWREYDNLTLRVIAHKAGYW